MERDQLVIRFLSIIIVIMFVIMLYEEHSYGKKIEKTEAESYQSGYDDGYDNGFDKGFDEGYSTARFDYSIGALE